MTYAATMNEPVPAVVTGYAGFWRRFVAYFIDSIILLAALSLLALARNVAKLVSDFTLLIGYIMAAFTSRKQALHDIMTGCVLIKRKI
jgi:uncharacterized RDD family membrane protein YckC